MIKNKAKIPFSHHHQKTPHQILALIIILKMLRVKCLVLEKIKEKKVKTKVKLIIVRANQTKKVEARQVKAKTYKEITKQTLIHKRKTFKLILKITMVKGRIRNQMKARKITINPTNKAINKEAVFLDLNLPRTLQNTETIKVLR